MKKSRRGPRGRAGRREGRPLRRGAASANWPRRPRRPATRTRPRRASAEEAAEPVARFRHAGWYGVAGFGASGAHARGCVLARPAGRLPLGSARAGPSGWSRSWCSRSARPTSTRPRTGTAVPIRPRRRRAAERSRSSPAAANGRGAKTQYSRRRSPRANAEGHAGRGGTRAAGAGAGGANEPRWPAAAARRVSRFYRAYPRRSRLDARSGGPHGVGGGGAAASRGVQAVGRGPRRTRRDGVDGGGSGRPTSGPVPPTGSAVPAAAVPVHLPPVRPPPESRMAPHVRGAEGQRRELSRERVGTRRQKPFRSGTGRPEDRSLVTRLVERPVAMDSKLPSRGAAGRPPAIAEAFRPGQRRPALVEDSTFRDPRSGPGSPPKRVEVNEQIWRGCRRREAQRTRPPAEALDRRSGRRVGPEGQRQGGPSRVLADRTRRLFPHRADGAANHAAGGPRVCRAATQCGDDLAHRFADTILWQPVIVLPSDGKAKLHFHLGNAPADIRSSSRATRSMVGSGRSGGSFRSLHLN